LTPSSHKLDEAEAPKEALPFNNPKIHFHPSSPAHHFPRLTHSDIGILWTIKEIPNAPTLVHRHPPKRYFKRRVSDCIRSVCDWDKRALFSDWMY
jgi:hypothetical protein